MKTKTIRIPKPILVAGISSDGNGWYAWKCDHKSLGYCTTGNTAAQAEAEFRDSLQDINDDSAADWLSPEYNRCRIQFAN